MGGHEEQYAVLVAGAGLAGVAAAVSAARAGARTAIVEKSFLPGGLGTAGLITWYSPLCDGRDTQVTFGLAEEFLHAGLRYGPGHVHNGWQDKRGKHTGRYESVFAPAAMVLALEELLLDAGVEVLYDTLVCQPAMRGERITGLEVEDREGRRELRARCIVDATGDALVSHRAGAPCDEAPAQDVCVELYEASLAAARRAVEKGTGIGLTRTKIPIADQNGRRYNANLSADATAFVLDARRAIREHYARRQAELGEEGRQDLSPAMLPAVPQVRRTRRIRGLAALSWEAHGKDVEGPVGLTSNWYPEHDGEVWQVPYGVLVPQRVKGLLAPGRNATSADPGTWDMLRIIHCCVLTGDVAGEAAAMCARQDTTPDALAVGDLQARLTARGFRLRHEPRA